MADKPCRFCGEVGQHYCSPNRPQKREKRSIIAKSVSIYVPPTYDVGFDEFWQSYPLQVGRMDALEAWSQKRPDLADVLSGLDLWKSCGEWQKEGGKFIPRAKKFLERELWKENPCPARVVSPDPFAGAKVRPEILERERKRQSGQK